MAWLERLDRRAETQPDVVQWGYVAIKAYLTVAGAIILGRVVLDRIGLWRF